MRTVFDNGGTKIEVTSGEAVHYRGVDGCSSFTPDSPGSVFLGVHTTPVAPISDPVMERTVAVLVLRPSEARALGSAILSAAAETSTHRLR